MIEKIQNSNLIEKCQTFCQKIVFRRRIISRRVQLIEKYHSEILLKVRCAIEPKCLLQTYNSVHIAPYLIYGIWYAACDVQLTIYHLKLESV